MTVKLFNPGNYATFSETCAKCHKNNETKCMYQGEDSMDTCENILKMCKKCIENTAEEGEMCYGDDAREHFLPKCKEHFEDSGMDVPKTPEEYLTIFGAYTGVYVSCLSLCSCFILIL
jgi:hypothetical protein